MADTTLLLTDPDRYRFPKFYLASFSAWLGSVSIGSAIGYTSVAIPTMKYSKDIELSSDQQFWLGSLIALGALFGSAIAGKLFNLSSLLKDSLLAIIF